MMWASIVPPTHMNSCLFCWNVGECIVENLYVLLDMPTEFVEACISKMKMPFHSKVRAIDLQNEASRNNGLILVLHGISKSIQIRFAAGIVGVCHHLGDHSWRGSAHEGLLRLNSLQRSFEVIDVPLHGILIPDNNRAITGGSIHTPAGTCAEDTLHHVWMIQHISWQKGSRLATEPRQAILDIAYKTHFPHLSIRNNINVRRNLMLDCLSHCTTHSIGEHRLIQQLAFFFVIHHLYEIIWPGQAPSMGR